MTDGLRAAAERIANPKIVWQGSPLGAGYRDICHEDAMAVARAYLVEHPADDDELITAEWWSQRIGETSHFVKWSPVQLWIEFDDQLPHVVKDNPTRGDVRRLLAALGITPK